MLHREGQPVLTLPPYPRTAQPLVLRHQLEGDGDQWRRPQPPFVRHVEGPTDAEDDRNEEVVRFMRRCYMIAGLFIVVTAWQWMILSYVFHAERDYTLIGFICLVSAFAILVTLTICSQFRRNYFFSCIMGWLFVETAAMGIVLIMPERSLKHICLALLGSLAVLVLCYLIGAWIPKVVLPGEITIFIFLIIFIVASIILLTLYLVTDEPKYKTLYFVLLGLAMIPISIYHSQIIHGRRFHVPYEEYVNYAISLYVNFLMFFACTYYVMWVHQW